MNIELKPVVEFDLVENRAKFHWLYREIPGSGIVSSWKSFSGADLMHMGILNAGSYTLCLNIDDQLNRNKLLQQLMTAVDLLRHYNIGNDHIDVDAFLKNFPQALTKGGDSGYTTND